jgi:hypothetical protein
MGSKGVCGEETGGERGLEKEGYGPQRHDFFVDGLYIHKLSTRERYTLLGIGVLIEVMQAAELELCEPFSPFCVYSLRSCI